MKALALCCTLTACLIALASPVPGGPRLPEPLKVDGDLAAMQGEWLQVTPTDGTTSHAVSGTLLGIDGNRMTIRHDVELREADFKLDPTATPKAITVRFPDGLAFGIYEFDGDTLRLCISEPGPNAVRPTQFRSFGKSVVLAEFRRLGAATPER